MSDVTFFLYLERVIGMAKVGTLGKVSCQEGYAAMQARSGMVQPTCFNRKLKGNCLWIPGS